MRAHFGLLFSGLAALCLLAPAAHASLPDIRGTVYVLSGTSRLGGTVLGQTEQADLDYTGVPYQIVADPANPNDPTKIQVNTQVPVPNTPCNTPSGVSITLKGTYNLTTGVFHVTGTRPGQTAVDTSLVDNGLLLNNGKEIWAKIQNAAISMTGVVTASGGRITITGSDALPNSGGPSTNFTFDSVTLSWVKVGDCNVSNGSPNLTASHPYGGFNWTATETSVSGQVFLEGNQKNGQVINFEFRPQDGSPIFTKSAALSSTGAYTVYDVLPGVYDIAIKGPQWLQQVQHNIDTTSGTTLGVTASLLTGDITDDNYVDIDDLGALAYAFGTLPTSPHWNPAADLDGNNKIDIDDLILLANNYGLQGDP